MKNRKNGTVAVATLFVCALAAAPVSSAFADGWHHGGHSGHYGGGPIWGFANALAATAAAVITAPIAILAAVAQAPLYYPQGPAYSSGSRGYDAPPPSPQYYGMRSAPADYRAAQAAPYYGPPAATVDYARAGTYYAPPQAQGYYEPRAAATYSRPPAANYYPERQAYYAPAPVDYGPPPDYYSPPPGANYYRR
jgi:hypothetical protein